MPREGLWAIGGDFNIPAADCRLELEGAPAVVVEPGGGEATCFPTLGSPSVLDYFVVSPAACRLLSGCKVLHGVQLATHRPVVLELRLANVPWLTRWVRTAAPVLSGVVYGPKVQTEAQGELFSLLAAER